MHAAPQAPQFVVLVCVSTHEPPQARWPVGQTSSQRPATQLWPLAQGVPQLPQFVASVWRSTQLTMPPAEQRVRGDMHVAAHIPATHICPAPQALPHPLSQDEQKLLVAFAERAPRLSVERQRELADLLEPLHGRSGAAAVAAVQGMAAGIVGAA